MLVPEEFLAFKAIERGKKKYVLLFQSKYRTEKQKTFKKTLLVILTRRQLKFVLSKM